MLGLHLYQSLDLVALSNRLAEVLAHPNGRPFHKDIIIIDGKGPSNWLTHALIREGGLGVQMNADLLSTWRMTPWLCSILRGDSRKERPADSLQGLTARLFALLQSDPGEWRDYVGDSGVDGGTVCWDLSVRLTRHYRDLLRNDADWIARAEQGAADRWSQLWREAVRGLRYSPDALIHEADVLAALSTKANRDKIAAQLPGRLCLFSAGDIPRSHLQILQVLSDVLEINLFVLQPSEGFIDDLIDYEKGQADESGEEPSRSTSYRLLRSCGKHYSIQQSKVIDLINGDSEAFIPSSRRADTGTLLGYIQNGIDDFQSQVAPLARPDESLSIHRCHGAWREAEVVRDQILAAFADPSLKNLRQGDILILSPTPEVHAPLLAGVLGAREPFFQFGTAGMQGIRKSPVGNLVKALLELPEGRVTSLDVMGILGLDVVRDHTGWTDSELEEVEEWFREAPFQWGINAEHRSRVLMAEPETQYSEDDDSNLNDALVENISTESEPSNVNEIGTLEEFLHRLALGTAFGGITRPIAGSLPLIGVDGQQSLGLAAESLRVMGAIRDWAQFALTEHTLNDWLSAFTKITQALRPHSRQHLEEFSELNTALSRIHGRIAQFGDTPVLLKLFSRLTEEYCDFEAGVGQFMTGKVTLAPLRAASIHPARIVILMGMNDGAFPLRPPKTGPEVVITEKGKEPTLTQLRIDSREDTSMHAFLLAILATKDRLIVTFDGYVGSEGKPASAALPIEILRATAQSSVKEGFTIRTHGLLSHHCPLPNGGTPDFVVRDQIAINVEKAIKNPVNKVLVPKLPKSAADFTWAEWIRFWESPPRDALRQLGVHVPWDKRVIATAEPLEPDSEARQQAEKWVKRCVKRKVEPQWNVAQLTGFFPPSPEGETLFDVLVITEKEAERLMIDELRKNLSPDKDKSLEENELLAGELKPFKTDQFRLFVHGDTVSVACLGYFSEDKHQYRWVMCLPAITAHIGRPVHRLFVTGVKPASPDEIAKAGEAELKIKIAINFLEVPPAELDSMRSSLVRLMDEVISETVPLMPITFTKGVEQRFLAKPVKISDDQLRIPEKGRGDGDDPRARILIPEQYTFPVMAEAITKLIPAGVRRLTKRDIKYARMTVAEQEAAEVKEKEEKAEKERLKLEIKKKKEAATNSKDSAPTAVKSGKKKKEDHS